MTHASSARAPGRPEGPRHRRKRHGWPWAPQGPWGWLTTPGARTLGQAFDPRHNNLNALRLVLAATVLVSHSWGFVRDEDDPLGKLTGGPEAGEVAVDGFFLLSGFLITRSRQRARSTGRFLWHRLLRILPGFWVCLAVTAVILGPLLWLLERDTLAGYPWTGADSALTYVAANALLRMHQFNIGDLNGGGALDGSLHTLFFEALCYLMIGILGAVGLLSRRRAAVLGLAVACWVLAAADAVSGADRLADAYALRFASMFLVGAVMFLYADRIPLNRPLLAASCCLLAIALAAPATYLPLAPAPLAYFLLWAGTGRRLMRVGSRRDLSYGIYVYSWPLQLLLLELGVGDDSVTVNIVASIGLSGAVAVASWHLVESPALALKSAAAPSWLGGFLSRPAARPGGRPTRPADSASPMGSPSPMGSVPGAAAGAAPGGHRTYSAVPGMPVSAGPASPPGSDPLRRSRPAAVPDQRRTRHASR
ncbi:acyltransferase [Parafrankia soli]|uniref:Acyltransferase n=1 Tax=Parafrankia soli TaxID=2599596 RepID=A0A1S1PHK2_9ACTN|nr:acyltransferase [Parafrankia soli]